MSSLVRRQRIDLESLETRRLLAVNPFSLHLGGTNSGGPSLFDPIADFEWIETLYDW